MAYEPWYSIPTAGLEHNVIMIANAFPIFSHVERERIDNYSIYIIQAPLLYASCPYFLSA